MTHIVNAPEAPLTNPPTFKTIIKTEEKGSDVNLAVHLINDYWQNKYKCAVVISNDSDLAEPLKLIKKRNDKIVGVICPIAKGHPSRELNKYANFTKKIRQGVLKSSQLPDPIPGTTISKPSKW
ncbi:NYN domain-containing protein [Desulfobacula sp.]|uniref:NYN domain-containing protein n=1 Tax=Desulfobacula sp. TaxID=2593537 RepID=UPI00260199CC|nr:NYN domain-containing protein [Desulfobacula sp.]